MTPHRGGDSLGQPLSFVLWGLSRDLDVAAMSGCSSAATPADRALGIRYVTASTCALALRQQGGLHVPARSDRSGRRLRRGGEARFGLEFWPSPWIASTSDEQRRATGHDETYHHRC